MSKFKMKLKLTGLEIELEGERADVPLMAAGIRQQLGNVIQPAIDIAANGQAQLPERADNTAANESDGKSRNSRGRKSVASREIRSPAQSSLALDFAHQPDTWGNPLQTWPPMQKKIWLLYVYEQATGNKELPATAIAPTFKKHFKQAGTIHPPHVTRELGKAKGMSPALVGEDATKNPPTWYLTDAGRTMGVQLVTEARGGATR